MNVVLWIENVMISLIGYVNWVVRCKIMYKRKDCIYKKNELKKLYYLYIIDIKLN